MLREGNQQISRELSMSEVSCIYKMRAFVASDGRDLNQKEGGGKIFKKRDGNILLPDIKVPKSGTIAGTKVIPSFRLKHELGQVGAQSRVNLNWLTMNFIVSLTSLHFGLECFHATERQLGAVAALSVWDLLIHMPTHAQGRRKTSPSSVIPSQAPSCIQLEKNCYGSWSISCFLLCLHITSVSLCTGKTTANTWLDV